MTKLGQAVRPFAGRSSRRVCGKGSMRDGRPRAPRSPGSEAVRWALAASRTHSDPRLRGDGPRMRGVSARRGRARRPPDGRSPPGAVLAVVKHSSAVEVRVRRLLRMLAALEEAIIRIEGRDEPTSSASCSGFARCRRTSPLRSAWTIRVPSGGAGCAVSRRPSPPLRGRPRLPRRRLPAAARPRARA
jgi:hypothetical protein